MEPARPRCLPLSHWGSGEGVSDPSSPPPHQPGLPPAFSAEKSRLRPSEDAVRPSPASFCPHSGCHLVRVGMGRDGSGMEAGGRGKRGRQGRGLLPTASSPCHRRCWSLRMLCPARWREDMVQVVGDFPADPVGRMSGGFEQWKINCAGGDTVPFTPRRETAAVSLQPSRGKGFSFHPCGSSLKEVITAMIYCSSPAACFIAGCKKVSTSDDDDFICPVP